MTPLVLTGPEIEMLRLAAANNLFRTAGGWRGQRSELYAHRRLMRLEALGLIAREYRIGQVIEAALATQQGRTVIAIADRAARLPRTRARLSLPSVHQHTEQTHG